LKFFANIDISKIMAIVFINFYLSIIIFQSKLLSDPEKPLSKSERLLSESAKTVSKSAILAESAKNVLEFAKHSTRSFLRSFNAENGLILPTFKYHVI